MSIVVSCGCGQTLQAEPNLYGQTVSCPGCRNLLTIPKPQPVQVACVCGATYMAEPHLFGTTLDCPNCRNKIAVPN